MKSLIGLPSYSHESVSFFWFLPIQKYLLPFSAFFLSFSHSVAENKVVISDLGVGHIQGSKILLRSNFLFLREWLRLVSDWLNFRALGSQNRSLSTQVSDHFPGWRNQMVGGSVMHPLFGLEGQGVPKKQAQAISAGITEVLEKVQESLMERTEMLQESHESKIKAEVQRSQMQLQREIEKLKNDMEKSIQEFRLARLEIDRDAMVFKAQILTTQRVIGEYCLGTVFTVCAVAFLVRLF
ncbi:uncharacterized protein LOC107642987 isoform X2 [Arachis ipaensis]|uniref:uncharacterized protein LOC107642987 isoform X2 n=1 Tax=Arachis ipaensis TaxID=130454 RepID=UPI000A2B8E84|nr:uncharacterized protein LOC107642987 isoform X2 [Arachis ipaensis]